MQINENSKMAFAMMSFAVFLLVLAAGLSFNPSVSVLEILFAAEFVGLICFAESAHILTSSGNP